jgi:SAM-dependent methyltransferase
LARSLRSIQQASRRSGRSELALARGSQRFWNDPDKQDLKTLLHWRGQGPFEDEALWQDLGRRHLSLFDRAAAWAGLNRPLEAIVEWGTGGGLNAVQFAPEAARYFGVDINPGSLRECARQVEAGGSGQFIPVLIDAADPEAALDQIREPCDLFLSTYVFELIPGPEYGLRVMRIACELLRPGGIAIVQVRYHAGAVAPPVSRKTYAANWLRLTSYAVDEFWKACESIGFEPMFVTLVPVQPELDEKRYAYFALKK